MRHVGRLRHGYGPLMPDPWFFVGLLMGIAIGGFAAVGSFGRGVDSVRRTAWTRELRARRRPAVVSRAPDRSRAA